jgi:putative oxidoreductase
MLRRILFGSEITGSSLANLGLTLLRMFTGIGLMTHGFSKFPPSAQFVEGVEKMGFPFAIAFAWAAALAEFAGGALLLAGLFTRPAAFFILFTMLVAVLGVHINDPFARKEMALLYGFLALAFLLMGAGQWSVDALIHSNSGKRRR